MEEIQYKAFSLNTHKKNWLLAKPNICQFELTFKCGLHCKHCYTDCYNKPAYLKKELNTKQIKLILDKIYNAGIIWLCFTGGDPLTRKDFLDIYSYAKNKGFIITVFTSGYLISKEIVAYFKKRPPFVIEMTLNAVTDDLYDKISQVKGSFVKVKRGISSILKAKLPLKIKTQLTKDNLEEIPKIKKFIQGLELDFRLSYDLHARLNGDLAPCNLRVSPEDILNLNGKKKITENDCRLSPIAEHRTPNTGLFRCAIGGGDGINLDPYGNMFACNLIRRPVFNLFKTDVKYTQNKLLTLVRGKKFTTKSKCNGCKLRNFCHSCPGRAYVEIGNIESPLEYYCELADETAKFLN